MSFTLTAESAVIDGARSYAERSGMTLGAFVLAYLKSVAKRERERLRPAWAGLCEEAITKNHSEAQPQLIFTDHFLRTK